MYKLFQGRIHWAKYTEYGDNGVHIILDKNQNINHIRSN